MAFIEQSLLNRIQFGIKSGPRFSTTVVALSSGADPRNRNWELPLVVFDFSQALNSEANKDAMLDAFWAAAGMYYGFRLRDSVDYLVDITRGIMGTGVGDGSLVYQLGKKYTFGSAVTNRKIYKPVSGQVAPFRAASPVTIGGAAGNVSIDYTTGAITFVADASSGATSITPGATTTVILTTNPGTLTAGKRLYLSGFAGTDSALINGLWGLGMAHTINSVAGSGPYTFVLATNTAGKTITLGSGLGRKGPQASETLTWSGQFDVPVRFDLDQLQIDAVDVHFYSCSMTATETRQIT
jgi:uncharacterized protein (TIGR02217 family)